jgi:hypothetical protein
MRRINVCWLLLASLLPGAARAGDAGGEDCGIQSERYLTTTVFCGII